MRDSWKGASQNTPDSALPVMRQPLAPSVLAATVTWRGQPAHRLTFEYMQHGRYPSLTACSSYDPCLRLCQIPVYIAYGGL